MSRLMPMSEALMKSSFYKKLKENFKKGDLFEYKETLIDLDTKDYYMHFVNEDFNFDIKILAKNFKPNKKNIIILKKYLQGLYLNGFYEKLRLKENKLIKVEIIEEIFKE